MDESSSFFQSVYPTSTAVHVTDTSPNQNANHIPKKPKKSNRQGLRDLEQSWMDRLQLISVITTFFAATEAQLLSFTTPSTPGAESSIILDTANACLSGSLIFHSFAAMLSFLAGFVLVKFRLEEAKEEEEEKIMPHGLSSFQDPVVMLQCVGFRQPPMDLLESYHWICIVFTMLGCILVASGILCSIWAMQVRNVGIFSSVCMTLCTSASLFVIISTVRQR